MYACTGRLRQVTCIKVEPQSSPSTDSKRTITPKPTCTYTYNDIIIVYFFVGDVILVELIDGDRLGFIKLLLPVIDTCTQSHHHTHTQSLLQLTYIYTQMHTYISVYHHLVAVFLLAPSVADWEIVSERYQTYSDLHAMIV